MGNNAGIHSSLNFFRYQYGDKRNTTYYYDSLFKNDSCLAGLTAVGSSNMLGWIKVAKADCPGMTVLGRLTPHEGIKETWGQGDPVSKALQWAKDVDEDLRLQGSLDNETRYIYWQPIDETKKNYEWHVKFDITAMNAMKDYGRRYAALNLYTGCPEQWLFDPVNEWDIIWPIIQEADRLGPAWVTLQTHAYIDTSQELTFAKQQYHALRPFYMLDRARAEGLNIQLIIGETGTLVGFPYANVPDFATYANILAWMWDQYQPYPEMKSINTYTNDTNGVDGNDLWLVSPEVVHKTRDYNIAHYDATTPVPEPEPEPLPGEIKIVNTVVDGWNSNIRTSRDTSTSANVVTTLAQGAKVGVGVLQDGWYEAWLSGAKIGLIRADRVT